MSILLSILIPSVRSREKSLSRLLNQLEDQIKKNKLEEKIEIIVFRDSMEYSVGHKCNIMIEKARGKYVCGIGDDDSVSDDYCQTLISKIEENPEVDQITFLVEQSPKFFKKIKGRYSINNKNFTFDFGFFKNVYPNFGNVENNRHTDFRFYLFGLKLWYNRSGTIIHALTSLLMLIFMWNFRRVYGYSWTVIPMKKEIASQVKFSDIPYTEDAQWIMKIKDLDIMKSEVFIDRVLYYYNENIRTSLRNDKHKHLEQQYNSEIEDHKIDLPNLVWI